MRTVRSQDPVTRRFDSGMNFMFLINYRSTVKEVAIKGKSEFPVSRPFIARRCRTVRYRSKSVVVADSVGWVGFARVSSKRIQNH